MAVKCHHRRPTVRLVTQRSHGERQQKEETYNEDGALAWVQHPQGLVLAGGENPGAVPVPAGAVDEVSVYVVNPYHRLPTGHVPQDHHVITACMEKKQWQ